MLTDEEIARIVKAVADEMTERAELARIRAAKESLHCEHLWTEVVSTAGLMREKCCWCSVFMDEVK